MNNPKFKAVVLYRRKPTNEVKDVSVIDYGRKLVALKGESESRPLKSVALLPSIQKTDVNGKDIYQDDLVRCLEDGYIRVVEWVEEECGFIYREFGRTISRRDGDEISRFMDPLYTSETEVERLHSRHEHPIAEYEFVQELQG